MKKILLIAILFIVPIGIAFGCCECTKVSYKFMDRIERAPFVAIVEVIRKDTISGSELGNPNSFAQSSGYSFTVVKILKQYSGKYFGQEIKIIDSKGLECFTKLFYKNIGDKFIVKGGVADINEYVYRDWDKQLPNENILVLGLCSTNQLQLDNNNITGWITLKGDQRSCRRRSAFLKIISLGLINRKKKGKEFMPQQMKLEKFEKKLSHRI